MKRVATKRVALLIAVSVVAVAGIAAGLASWTKVSQRPAAGEAAERFGRPAAGERQNRAKRSVPARGSPARKAGFGRPSLSRPLRNIAPAAAGKTRKKEDELKPLKAHGYGYQAVPGSAALQTRAGRGEMPAPLKNFDGVNNINNSLPPDTEGDVG